MAGQQGVERYAAHGVRMSRSQMVVVGRPQIERIKLREQPLPPGAPRTVLYAPTWQGGKPTTNYSSLALGAKIVTALLERGATVIFRPHPFSYRDPRQTRLAREIQQLLKQDRERTGREHVWGKQAEKTWDIPDCFNHSDALITDVSSVASDFLATGKPLAMVAIQQSGEAFPDEIPMARVAYVIEKDLSTLDEAVDSLFGDDPWPRSAGPTGSTAWVSGSASMPPTDSSRPPGASSRAVTPSRRPDPQERRACLHEP